MKSGGQRCAWISCQVMDDGIRAGPGAIQSNDPQHFIRHRPHRCDVLHFVIGNPGVVDYRGSYDLIRISNQDAARLAITFLAQLYAVLHGHKHDSPDQGNAFRRNLQALETFAIDDALCVRGQLLRCLN